MTPKKDSKPGFEQALAELEELVTQMEKGEMSLEDSLSKFEKGIQLTRICQDQLKSAEQKVQMLVEKDHQYQIEDVHADD